MSANSFPHFFIFLYSKKINNAILKAVGLQFIIKAKVYFMKKMHMITFLLLVIGGLNWLLQGLFGWEIGQIFGGQDAAVSRLIYVLVGISAILELAGHKKSCTYCAGNKGMGSSNMMHEGKEHHNG